MAGARHDRHEGRAPSRFDRPPPPHDWRWLVGGVGKVLIATGLLLFAFVGYMLWGTGIEYSQAQDDLDAQWRELVSSTSTVPPTTVAPSTTTTAAPTTTTAVPTTTTVAVQDIPVPAPGDVVGRLNIPAIDLHDENVVSGVGVDELKKGPGHFPETPMPGQLGNAALAGHRTTYGGPFYSIDELMPGDEIRIETLAGTYLYRVTGTEIVDPSDYHVVTTTDPTKATLVLVSCHPLRSAKQRIIIHAELDATASSPVGAMTSNYAPLADGALPPPSSDLPSEGGDTGPAPTTTTLPPTTTTTTAGTTTATTTATVTSTTAASSGTPPTRPSGPANPGEVTDRTADAFSHGWFDDTRAWPQIALWGAGLVAIALGAYRIAHRTRRYWVGTVVGIAPFLVILYFFFQNVYRLLPPGI